MVRAKFQVTAITSHSWGGTEIVLEPRYDSSIPEDRRFSDATPSGKMTMLINNPAAVDQLKLGQFFYVDFTPVPAQS